METESRQKERDKNESGFPGPSKMVIEWRLHSNSQGTSGLAPGPDVYQI